MVDYTARWAQGPHTSAVVWNSIADLLKKRGLWVKGVKNEKRALTLIAAVKEVCSGDDWWMDYYGALLNDIRYDPDRWASYERRTKQQVIDHLRQMPTTPV